MDAKPIIEDDINIQPFQVTTEAEVATPTPTAAQDVNAQVPRWWLSTSSKVVRIAAVIVGTYAGVWTRIGLSVLTVEAQNWSTVWRSIAPVLDSAPGSASGFLLPNIVGCMVMGAALRLSEVLTVVSPVTYTAITTGFCGCCTTLSTWMVFICRKFVAQDVLGALLLLAIHIPIFFGSFRLGEHVAGSVMRHVHPALYEAHKTNKLRMPWLQAIRRVDDELMEPAASASTYLVSMKQSAAESLATLDSIRQHSPRLSEGANFVIGLYILAVLATAGMWLGAGLSDFNGGWLAAALGPAGSVLRYLLSLYNKTPVKCGGSVVVSNPAMIFPPFTFFANLTASLVAAGLAVATKDTDVLRIWLGAISTGVCGSLSTVSSWVAESMLIQKRRFAYLYVLGTITVCQLLLAAVLAPYV